MTNKIDNIFCGGRFKTFKMCFNPKAIEECPSCEKIICTVTGKVISTLCGADDWKNGK